MPLRTYFHYSTAPPESFGDGLWPGSSATPLSGLMGHEAADGLGIPLPTFEFPVTIDPALTQVVDGGEVEASSRYSGGLPQVFFPDGTPPGTVGMPNRVP